MIVTKKRLSRRTFLRGAGVTVALPWLDAMVPAFAAPADVKPPVRLVFAYVPNGMMMDEWKPRTAGRNFEFPRILKPLEPVREDMMVLTGPDPKVRARLGENRKSMLDYIMSQTERLAGTLGPSDRRKIDEYLTSLRDIEKRIARVESENERELTPDMEKPLGVPNGFVEHARLMNDLLRVALQADLTRVATL